MDGEETRDRVIDRISKLADEIREGLSSISTNGMTKDYSLQISIAIENTEYIKENISYTPNLMLKTYESEMESVKNNLKRIKNNTDLDKISYSINRIKSNVILYKDAAENAALVNDKSYERGFNTKANELSKKFDETKSNLQKIRYVYAFFAIVGSVLLGYGYISFYFEQFKSGYVIYTNHLMLIAVCSPIIFLIIWLYWQLGHYTRLIDIYTFKANLGYTLKSAIDYVLSIEKDSIEKKVALETLKSLLDKLYESPIKDDVSKSAIIKGIGETTKMLKEIKEIVNSK